MQRERASEGPQESIVGNGLNPSEAESGAGETLRENRLAIMVS